MSSTASPIVTAMNEHVGHVRHADDFYRTPAWCVEAILPYVIDGNHGSAFDPCCGDGALLVTVQEWCHKKDLKCLLFGMEINAERRAQAELHDIIMLGEDAFQRSWDHHDLIITNPPYKHAEEFVRKALRSEHHTIAMLLRLGFMSSMRRKLLHEQYRSDVYVLPRRPSFTENGKTDSSDYAWFVWGSDTRGEWRVLDL